jgi:lipoyl(octanoyl) transferase
LIDHRSTSIRRDSAKAEPREHQGHGRRDQREPQARRPLRDPKRSEQPNPERLGDHYMIARSIDPHRGLALRVGGSHVAFTGVRQQQPDRDGGHRRAAGVRHPHGRRLADLDLTRTRFQELEQQREDDGVRHDVSWQTMTGAIDLEDLGRAPYDESHRYMLDLADSIRRGASPGKILMVEHEPVFTAGRATPEEEVHPGVIRVERGGRMTYHGPGQLVVYPVLPLARRDLRAWLQQIERFGVACCAYFGLTATPSVDRTGVFVAHHKVASIGVAVRHWINLHGMALNVDLDLTPFSAIRPCGLDPAVMSDLTRELGRLVRIDEAKAAVRASAGLLSAW